MRTRHPLDVQCSRAYVFEGPFQQVCAYLNFSKSNFVVPERDGVWVFKSQSKQSCVLHHKWGFLIAGVFPFNLHTITTHKTLPYMLWQQPTIIWQPHCRPSIHAKGDTEKTTCVPTAQRHPVVSSVSQYLSLMALTAKTNWRPGETQLTVCERHHSTKKPLLPTNHCLTLVKPVCAKRSHIPRHGWLILKTSKQLRQWEGCWVALRTCTCHYCHIVQLLFHGAIHCISAAELLMGREIQSNLPQVK